MIVACSKFPLSIIIVGIGDADFSVMHYLDSDDNLLVDGKGVPMKRDIAQFVELNEFKKDNKTNVN